MKAGRTSSFTFYTGLLVATLLLSIGGCDAERRVSVTGRVVRQDKTPIVGAAVIVRSDDAGKWGRGVTDTNGHYALGLATAGDGIPPGRYRVVIMEERGERAEKPRTIAAKYENPSTSGLELDISDGKNIVFDITLDPPSAGPG